MNIIGIILIFIGVIFSLLGSIGILRMKDLYNRLQTSTKATTLGAFSTIIGVGFLHPSWFFKLILISFFILITAPIASHSLARASHKTGVALKKDQFDALKNENGETK
ncbi:MAG: monovalent cation/H(+) antiporter subunit G [candidate division WOR-3 bacterium]